MQGRESLVLHTGLNFHFSPDTPLRCWASAMLFQKVGRENRPEEQDLAKVTGWVGAGRAAPHHVAGATVAISLRRPSWLPH